MNQRTLALAGEHEAARSSVGRSDPGSLAERIAPEVRIPEEHLVGSLAGQHCLEAGVSDGSTEA